MRAQDKHFLAMLSEYAHLINTDASMDQDEAMRFLAAVNMHIKRAEVWQHEHGCKSPDL